jgi:BirA family biotin operon repressor/biotin-[acetyl-CoA-carboxylase] ligase
MATPYLQLRKDEVPSTQDLARAGLDRLPVVVISQRQTAGRGRTGASWVTAPRALAVSAAFEVAEDERRPLSLMAGVAAVAAVPGELLLKWPNDIVVDDLKLGGILVERSGAVVVVGMGLNLWWPEAPEEVGSLLDEDPGPEIHATIGGLWAAELLRLVDLDGWPIDEYRKVCVTLGRTVTWEPGGSGVAVDVTTEGELIVEDGETRHTINSGTIRHLRG